jgi:hypothetical protein
MSLRCNWGVIPDHAGDHHGTRNRHQQTDRHPDQVCGAADYVAQAAGRCLWSALASILRHIFECD